MNNDKNNNLWMIEIPEGEEKGEKGMRGKMNEKWMRGKIIAEKSPTHWRETAVQFMRQKSIYIHTYMYI